jgi:hypothetical protein
VAFSVITIQKLRTKTHMQLKMTFTFVVGGFSGVIGFVKIDLACHAISGVRAFRLERHLNY